MNAIGKICALCWVAVILIWIISAFSVKRTLERQPLTRRMFYLGLIILVVVLNFSLVQLRLNWQVIPSSLTTGIIGDILTLLGLQLTVWARASLGSNWSGSVTFKENHELIQTGPYHFVRHPIYSGLMLMILGTAIITGRLTSFIALPIAMTAFWIKLSEEEQLLVKHFPDTYPRYKARTKALIPFVL